MYMTDKNQTEIILTDKLNKLRIEQLKFFMNGYTCPEHVIKSIRITEIALMRLNKETL